MYQRKTCKFRSIKEMELDKISNLPSDVIEKILSHLPLKEAVRTSVLSRKWRYKSATLPHLVFDDQSVSTQNQTTFANIVNQVLLLHIGPIHMFKLAHPNLLATSDIDRWVLHLSRNSIKELILEIWKGPHYKTPACLFSCQDLINLDLYYCLLKPPSTFKGLRNLKSLNLDNVTMAQDVLENLIACCPLLERLSLWSCGGFPNLKINAPSLQALDVSGNLEDFSLENTLNLANLYIEVDIKVDQRQVPESPSNLIKFLVHLPHIQRLTIQGHFLKYLADGALPGKLPKPCLNLSFLYLSICFNNWEEILTALCLLRSSPALEELEILACQADQAVVGEVNSWLDDNQNCPLTKLRRVNISCFYGVNAELDFIRFLLLSSPVLEMMTINAASDNNFKELVKKLLRFRRASVNAEIIYFDPNDS